MDPFNLHLDPNRCALLVIDMQNDFVSPGGYSHRQGKPCEPMQAIIPNIQSLLYGLPKEVKRIYIVTAREPDGSDCHWRFHKILPKQVHHSHEGQRVECNVLRGTWGAEIVDPLKPGPEDHIFCKRRNSAFYQTDLEMCLRCWGIDTLIFTGVAAEICVETTLRDAFIRDFDIVAVSDAIASWDTEAFQAMLRLTAQNFGMVLPSIEIRKILFSSS
jgi:ureidoacrylate peracid hydrolase